MRIYLGFLKKGQKKPSGRKYGKKEKERIQELIRVGLPHIFITFSFPKLQKARYFPNYIKLIFMKSYS